VLPSSFVPAILETLRRGIRSCTLFEILRIYTPRKLLSSMQQQQDRNWL
jgi:hypothetical protein